MSATTPIEMRPPDDVDGDAAEYRSLSPLAVVSLLLGLASALNFVSPALVVIPLAAFGAALLAFRSIAASGGALAGRGVTCVGLALAAFFAAAAPAHQYSRDNQFTKQASEAARTWAAHLASDRPEEALKLTAASATRRLTPQTPMGLPALGLPTIGEPAQPSVSSFSKLLRDDPVAVALRGAGGSGEPRLRLVDSTLVFPKGQVKCFLVLEATGEGGGGPVVLSISAVLPRFLETPQWMIDEWGFAEASGSGG